MHYLIFQSTQKKDNEAKSAFFEQGLNNLSLQERANTKEAKFSLKPPPPPSTPVSPSSPIQRSPTSSPRALATDANFQPVVNSPSKEILSSAEKNDQDNVDDDFGDFQAAG